MSRRRRNPQTTTGPQRKKIAQTAAGPQRKKIAQTAIGHLRMHARGFGFVVPDDLVKWPQDIFIPKHLTDNAVDGDRVEVEINPNSQSEKGPEGKIIAIIQRGRTHIAGILIQVGETTLAHIPLLGPTKPATVKKKGKSSYKVGDRVILKVLDWGDQKTGPVCEVSNKIGHIDSPASDIPAAIEEYDLLETFPKEAINQAKEFGTKVTKEQLKGRLDLTKKVSVTIDPETAKDFDDALSISKDKRGHYFLDVHIADVAFYVPPGSPLDLEAKRRSNSTYFPGTCIPMLPEELSNNLCSLRQGVIRLTVTVLMEFDKEGTLVKSDVQRSYIKSKKRFTYGEAREVIEGKVKSPHAPELKLMVELCQLLKKKRSLRGSIDFAMPDLIVVVNKKGEPTGIKIEEYDVTHQMVEEFMLKANEIVAKTLSDRGKPVLYRVHEEPSEENMEDFFHTARSLGFTLPNKPSHDDLQKLFEAAKKTTFGQQLAISFIRNLRLAQYSPDNVGHFGLALEYYCHFTSPIRRYSDLITERLLFNEEGDHNEYDRIAKLCSERERISFRAEMSVKQLKKLRLLKKWFEEDPEKYYPAAITKIKPFGFFFDMKALFLEGFLHISELEDDYFVYDEKLPALIGERTGARHTLGEEINVRPTSIDLILLVAKWELEKGRDRVKTKKRR